VTAIWLREDEQQAARYLLSCSFESFDPELLAKILTLLEDLDSSVLQGALDHRSPQIRAKAIDVLSGRNLLDLDTIGRAKQDDAAVVRFAALQASERAEQPVSLDEARKIMTFSKRRSFMLTRSEDTSGLPYFDRLRAARMRSMSAPSLEALLAVPEHRDAAYRGLAARRVGDYGERLRADLSDGFERYFLEHWPDGIPQENTSILGSLMLSINPDSSKKRELIKKALDIVVDQRDPTDLALVRHVIDSHQTPPTASVIAFLKALGGAEDIPRLALTPMLAGFLADSDHSKIFDEAARLILKFAKGAFAELLDRPMADAMKSRIIEIVSVTDFAALSNERIASLVLGSSEDIRRATAKKIAASLPKSRVKKLLYMYKSNEDGRYYIVPHWLDLGLAYPKTVARVVTLATG
jgi:hypothetical protein